MMLEVNTLRFSYGSKPVLRDLSFRVPKGALVAVLGPNGAGKSTLFRCILGLLRGAQGEILLDGKPQNTLSRREKARLAAYVPQSAESLFSYTVEQTVLMGTTGSLRLLQYPGRAELQRAQQALSMLQIPELAQRRMDRISGGERQLVLLARALVQNAKLLLMDEPTANLDYGNQQRVLARIAALTQRGYTVLLSTHHPEHALRYSSHVLALQDGSLAAFGPTQSVLTEALVERLYRFPVRIAALNTENGPVQCCVPLE